MQRVMFIGLFVGLLTVLTGCHENEEQAKLMYQKLEKAAMLEKDFAAKQQALEKASENERAIYNEIIHLDIANGDQMKEKRKKAKHLVEKRRNYLQEVINSFQDAYSVAAAISDNIEAMSESKKKDKAISLEKIMQKRHTAFKSFCKKYEETLKAHENFYKQLGEKQLKANKLEQLIKSINLKNEKLAKLADQFNHYTKKYNQKRDEGIRSLS